MNFDGSNLVGFNSSSSSNDNAGGPKKP